MSHIALKAAALAACLTFAGGAAQAATLYKAVLAGAAEVPANASPGTGSALLTLDGDMLDISLTFSGLMGPTAAAHIHCCVGPTGNAGVATQIPTFSGFPLGVTSGSFNQSFDLSLASSYNPNFITLHGSLDAARAFFINGLNAGEAYFNIHTAAVPSGEIRGNLSVVPEPGTWALLISGFGLAGAALRRRRHALA